MSASTTNSRRNNPECFFEPIFDPNCEISADPYDWDAAHNSGPSYRIVHGETLKEKVTPENTFSIETITFKFCDFKGVFDCNTLLFFDNCKFVKCDFAYTRWKDVHFRNCEFIDSSISLAAFAHCQFRDCKWERIGFGSRTEFDHCFINNPNDLVKASISKTKEADKSWEHRLHQWHRLSGTRAHVLRTIMTSHQTTGDEHTYYETVQLHDLQCSKARFCKSIYDIYTAASENKLKHIIRLLLLTFDYTLLRGVGWLNSWGSSPGRPAIALAACFFVFGMIYRHIPFDKAIDNPFQKSFDITLLVGYTNQAVYSDRALTIVQDIHTILAIIIYTVFFATIVSKLSRVR